jgi:hypothetical protein
VRADRRTPAQEVRPGPHQLGIPARWIQRFGGGEPNSVHIYDYPGRNFAADITCETGSPAEWYAFTAGKADGRGIYSTFHHADNRGRIPWPDATWSG